jgi:hypothetical protein
VPIYLTAGQSNSIRVHPFPYPPVSAMKNPSFYRRCGLSIGSCVRFSASQSACQPSSLLACQPSFQPASLSAIQCKEIVPTLQDSAESKKRHETDDHPERHTDILEHVSCYLLKLVMKALLYMPERIVSRRQNEPFSANVKGVPKP